MSKIYKVEDVATLPAYGESGVLYLVQVDSAREAYIWNGTTFTPVNPSDKWVRLSAEQSSGSTWPTIDISRWIDKYTEFLCVFSFNASQTYYSSVQVTIPNLNVAQMGAAKQDYFAGYYYDENYNACILFRLNRTSKTISVVKAFSHITSNATVAGNEILTIFGK